MPLLSVLRTNIAGGTRRPDGRPLGIQAMDTAGYGMEKLFYETRSRDCSAVLSREVNEQVDLRTNQKEAHQCSVRKSMSRTEQPLTVRE